MSGTERENRISPEEMARIEALRRKIEERGYPDVWVGEVGMTAAHKGVAPSGVSRHESGQGSISA